MPGRAARHSVQDHSGPSPTGSNIWFPNWREGASEWTISGSKSTGLRSRPYECVSALEAEDAAASQMGGSNEGTSGWDLIVHFLLTHRDDWKVFLLHNLVLPSLWCLLNIWPMEETPSWPTGVMHRWASLSRCNFQRTENFVLSLQIQHTEWWHKRMLPPVGCFQWVKWKWEKMVAIKSQ